MLSGEIMVSPGRFGSRDRSLGGVNLVIYDHVDNVNSRRVKLARQRLTEHPQNPLAIASGAKPARLRSAAVAPVSEMKPWPALSISGMIL
jgi:hypothetical protein